MAGSGNWIEWAGGKCPVEPETLVEVQYRPNCSWLSPTVSSPAPARFFQVGTDWWRHESPNQTNDIIAYRLAESRA
jgi:hypothetical protein